MSFRKKRSLLLASVAILLLLSILDISFRKEEIFEEFGIQFVNVAKTEAHERAHEYATATDRRKAEVNGQGVKEIVLNAAKGKVTVKRSENTAIKLEYSINAVGDDQGEADRRKDAIQVMEELHDGTLTWLPTANGKEISYDFVTVDYDLYVPDGVQLRLGNNSGDVVVHGIQGDVKAKVDRGMLDVAGHVTAESSFGNLYISGIHGNVTLANRYSDVNMERVTGAVLLDSEFSRVMLTDLEGDVTGMAEQGSVLIRDHKGSVELTGQVADLVLDHVRGDIRVQTDSGDISLILLEAEGYTLDAAVSGGRIQTSLPFPVEKLANGEYTRGLKGTLGKGAWKVDAKAKSGDVSIHLK
jgi:hypothetical protein